MKYIALDTETIAGKAFLLSTCDKVYEIRTFFDFIRALEDCLPTGKRTACFVWYNIDYDVTGIVKHLPRRIIRELFIKQRSSWRGISLKYLVGKYFELRYQGKSYFHYDIYSFFQMSLDAAAKRFLGSANSKMEVSLRMLRSMTWKRYYQRKKYWDNYAMQDARLLQALVDNLQISLEAIGHSSKHIYSPGFIAKTFWVRRGINFGWLAPNVEKFVSQAYHGACVEIYQRGFFKKAWSYDVKSAYPYALSQLPDFSNATYTFDQKQKSRHYFLQARVWMPSNDFYLLPVSRNGVTIFPRFCGQIAYITNEEHECLLRNGCKVVPIQYVNIHVSSEDFVYAPIISELFEKRKESGMNGLVYKLILNSSYGVTAESRTQYRKLNVLQALQKYERERQFLRDEQFIIDQSRLCPQAKFYWMRACECDICEDTRAIMRKRVGKGRPVVEYDGELYDSQTYPGRMRNLAVAAKITAITRVKMFELKKLVPRQKLISCFTDGLKTACPIAIELGDGLGEVSMDVNGKELIMVGCGVYQHGEVVKIRGFHYRGDLKSLLQRQRRNRIIQIPTTSRLTGMEYVHLKESEVDELNLIVRGRKQLDINFDMKRAWPRAWRNCEDLLSGNMSSKPLDFLY